MKRKTDTRLDMRRLARLRRLLWLAAAGIAVAAGIVVVRTVSHRAAARRPPQVDLSDTYEEVADSIQTAREMVLDAPRSARRWGHYGMVLEAHAYHDAARRCFVQAERLDPQDYRWPYLQAMTLAETDVQRAIACCRRSAALREDRLHVRLRLAQLLLETGKPSEAAQHLRIVRRERPDDPATLLLLARAAYRNGRLHEAVKWARQAVDEAPRVREPRAFLARLYHRLDKRDAAQQTLSELERLPDNELTWRDPLVQQVMQLRRDPHWRVQQARRLVQEGQVERGLQQLENVVAAHPEVREFPIELGRALLQTGHVNHAHSVLHDAIERHPSDAELRYLLGLLHVTREEWKKAVHRFREATARKPDHAMAYYNLGQALLRVERKKRASEAFKQAVSLKSDLVEARINLGRLLLQAGKCAEAADHLQAAAQLKPDDAEVRQLLKRASPEP